MFPVMHNRIAEKQNCKCKKRYREKTLFVADWRAAAAGIRASVSRFA
jgi:hypothetical protein